MNKEYKLLVTSVFATLIGFLIAIFALLPGERKFLKSSTSQRFNAEIRQRTGRLKILFGVYFVALLLMGISYIVVHAETKAIADRMFLGVSILGWVLSAELPRLLSAYKVTPLKK